MACKVRNFKEDRYVWTVPTPTVEIVVDAHLVVEDASVVIVEAASVVTAVTASVVIVLAVTVATVAIASVVVVAMTAEADAVDSMVEEVVVDLLALAMPTSVVSAATVTHAASPTACKNAPSAKHPVQICCEYK